MPRCPTSGYFCDFCVSKIVKHLIFDLDVAILLNILIQHLSVDELGHECFVFSVSVPDDSHYQFLDLPLSYRSDCL